MEEYNSDALRTVEDIANNIPMDISINEDIHKNSEPYNELQSKISDTSKESVIAEHSNSENLNFVGNEIASESAFADNENTDSIDISANIQPALDNVHSNNTGDIENILNAENDLKDTVSDNLAGRMDWAQSDVHNDTVSNSFTVSDNVTSDNGFNKEDSFIKNVENTFTDSSLSSEKSLKSNIEDKLPTQNESVPESTTEKLVENSSAPTEDGLPAEKQSDEAHSSDIAQNISQTNNMDHDADHFSVDRDASDLSTGLAMLEDLSEIPSESYPELEPETERSVTGTTVKSFHKESQNQQEPVEKMDTHTADTNPDTSNKNSEKEELNTISNDVRISTVAESKASGDTGSKSDTTETSEGVEMNKKSDESRVEPENIDKDNQNSSNVLSESVTAKESNTRENLDVSKTGVEVDPIASDNFGTIDTENREGADAELCIIPDTEREISQAEKDAASSIPPLRDISEATATTQPENNVEAASATPASTSPIVVFKYEKDDMQICNECKLKRKVKYYYTLKEENEQRHLCDDNCLNVFKSGQKDKVALNWEEGGLRVKNFTGATKEPPSLSFIRRCASCNKETNDIDENLTWEIMDFCNEDCVTKYQKDTGSHCSSCQGEVTSNSLGKYCVRFGNDIRQFCTSLCLEKYKKGLKVCSYCQQDMSGGGTGFLAPVGDKGQFKDFCSQVCMEKYDVMTNDRPPKVASDTICSVCKAVKPITIEFELDGSPNYFCGEPCFVAFSFVNNISPGKCAMCRRHFPKSTLEKHTMYYDNVQHSFCSTSCENIYIIAHRKIVPCSWCKVKKYNFDMIRRYSKKGPMLNMCSVNCLSLYRVSLDSINARQNCCNFCQKITPSMYHLTMSDTSVRNFCSYTCVVNFQNQFKHGHVNNRDDQSYPVPTGQPRRNKHYSGPEQPVPAADPNQMPIISTIQSLASTNGNLVPSSTVPPSLTPINTRSTRSKSSTVQPVLNSTPQVINSFSEIPFQVQIKQHFIVRPAPLPEQRNVGTMCYTRKMNKGVTAKPSMVDQEVQTEEKEARKILIPVPVPIYVPTPMHMYSTPAPIPVPIPVPIPIPIFIPTTRNSAAGIMKEIKKIQVKIPTDPYEAELLMMAEMVAEEKKEEITDSESDVDDTGGPEDSYSPEPVDASNTFGDDMLQMALKMATELDEPAVDLEGALTANTITAPQGGEPHPQEENVDDPQPMHHHMMERSPSARGRKRGMRQPRGGAKRGRRMSHHQVDMPMMQHHQVQQPPPPPEPAEKPDANMCLKYTFGVNAWKQWVTTKNTELEKSSRLVKLFNTEILQLTSDELNYSLCLFVKEVRKPNGAEYAPDTIYYLCLGIQQYLFENGRIDNIFCDAYYEKFTDCLDEVAKKFSVLYNDSHYIVTRVEEEHLWESKQLGAHSPHVLLSTLMFFNTKHFNLTSVDEHMQLSFSHIMKHWKRNPNQPGASKVPGSRNVLLRFYPPQSAIQNNARKKKVYEQQENEENPLRCPVKLYEFYLSKCPESVKTRNDVFYLQPERSCVPDSPVWYSTMPLPKEALEKMLHRVKMVKEINVALLTS